MPVTFHCFFEQSGTFKNEFKKLGYEAYDYDILDDFGETDYKVDLFKEIDTAFERERERTVFDNVKEDDQIFAFFPCIRFECKIPLWFRGQAQQQKNWSDVQKLEYAMNLQHELSDMYTWLSRLVIVCIRRNIKLIIENPYTQPHYLTNFFPIKPKLIDYDRSERGDNMRKPTQYWFINRDPSNNLFFEPQVINERRTHDGISKNRDVVRSLISPDYANRFIREFII